MFVANLHAVLFLSSAIAQKAGVGNYPDQIADVRYVVNGSHACVILLPSGSSTDLQREPPQNSDNPSQESVV